MNEIEILLATTSILIALAALFLSVWSGWETRRHNRLSVYPFLDFWVKSTWDDKYAGICVKNNGAGPAVIKEVRVYVDNKGVNGSQIDMWDYVVKRLNLNPEWVYIEYLNPGAAIRPEQEIWFVAADTEKIPNNAKVAFLEEISRLSLKIVYESIYREVSDIGINVKDYLAPWDKSNKQHDTKASKKNHG